MEWLVMMGGGLNAVSSNLGWHNGEFYEVSDECEENLCEMITSLKNENRVTRPVRRTYAASRLIEMDLFPILTASKDQPDVYHRVVQLLVELTMPMEITMPCYSSMNTEDVRTRDALKKMLIQVKKLFNDKKVTEAIVNQMRYVLIESKTEESWDKSMFEPVEDSLKLVRNILHICDDSLSLQIIQSLMSAGFGDVIIEVCEAEVQTSLVSSILAIICLLFRNYNANDIENEARKLVAASESCPPESSQMSEEMQQDAEVSSDNSKCASSPGLPVDNLQIAEGGCKEVSVKDALKPIMVRFALKFVKGSLNEILKTIAKTEINQFFTDLHFLWHLTFFLPLTMIPTIKYQHISTFLSPAVICTLSYLTLDTWEQYNKAQQNKKDSESNMCFKRLHLLMTCQHYYFSCLHHFHGIAQTAEESERLQHSISSVMQAKSIHLMYVLLLRKYKSNMETLAYLKELINGNHKLLALSNFANSQSSFEMREHIKCFATPKVVLTYNELLKLFATNTLAVNERIMHMYHHIVIDLNKPELLHQVPILSTISEMWAENSDRISQESYELMDYVIFLLCKKYISSKKRKAMRCVLTNPYTNWRKEKQKKKKLKRLKKEFTMKNLDNISHTGLYILPTSSEGEISEDEQDGTVEENVATLKKIGYSKELKLLQDLLLEMCSLKLDCSARHMAEPHVWPYASVGKSVPMVAYTQGQELLQEEEIFSSLMRQLGIQKDSSHLFPTIPSFWTAEMCFETASKLGPLDPADFKFEVTESGKPKFESQRTFLPEESGKEAKPSSSSSSSHKSVQDLAYRLPGSSWLMMVQAGNLC